MTDAADHAAQGTPSPKLLRRLGVTDAVLLGLGSMIGTGVFVVFAPGAAAAGSGLLIGLAIAAFVAYANATSSAELAALYPASGGTYVYGRERLGAMWGYLAGIAFVSGKIASCAAAALAVGVYAAPGAERPVAVAAVVFITAVNYFGITKTAALNRVLVTLLLAVLTIVVVATLGGGSANLDHLTSWFPNGIHGVLQAGGLLFFAFAGYARIATLGEEVRDPERTIPRAIPLALGIALVLYTIVAVSVLLVLGPDHLARATAPLYTAVATGRFEGISGIVRVGAVLAALGVFLSLVAGISRTTYAMASHGDLPRWFAAVHPRYHVPHRAELAVGAITVAIVSVGGITGAVSFSAFSVLLYYAIANASAYTLDRHERRWPRWLAVAGLVGCLTLAVNLPWPALVAGVIVVAAAAVTHRVVSARRSAAESGGPARGSA
jgi:APA family basic amino acid/polyamine antiporter